VDTDQLLALMPFAVTPGVELEVTHTQAVLTSA
jgi:hypothetical protein